MAIGSVPEQHITTYNGFAEVTQQAPAVHLADGFHFYYTDHLGSTCMLDDFDSGVADMSVDYLPFGQKYSVSGGGEGTAYKFTGHEEDSGIGLYYARARYYNPAIGRFLTPDPAGQSWNPYSYVGNRPLDFVDPDGRWRIPIVSGFVNLIGKGIKWHLDQLSRPGSINTLPLPVCICRILGLVEQGPFIWKGDLNCPAVNVILLSSVSAWQQS